MYVSCNLFSNLWIPFFKLIKKYIKFPITTYLCSDIEISEKILEKLKEFDVKIVIYGEKSNISKNGNLYKRYEHYLNNITYESILYFHDDMFPSKMIDENELITMLNVLNSNNNIKLIKLSLSSSPYLKGSSHIFHDTSFIKADNKRDSYIFNIQPMLIKKIFFKNMINYCEENYKKQKITHLNGGLELVGRNYFENNLNFIALRVVKEVISVYGGSYGICVNGIINDNVDIILKNNENIELEVYEKKCIFKVTTEELNIFGDQNKNRLIKHLKNTKNK